MLLKQEGTIKELRDNAKTAARKSSADNDKDIEEITNEPDSTSDLKEKDAHYIGKTAITV